MPRKWFIYGLLSVGMIHRVEAIPNILQFGFGGQLADDEITGSRVTIQQCFGSMIAG